MRFQNQIFPSYDAKPITATFADFFNGAVGSEPFVLSGLSEVRQTLLMTEEWMQGTQSKLNFHEKDLLDPGIYRDGNGLTGYGRVVSLPIRVVEQERQFIWKNGQAAFEQKFEAFVSPVSLHRTDYFPAAGDVFKWRDTWRQINAVKVNPTDYFQNTGFPLYIMIESSPWVPELGLGGTLPCGPLTVAPSGSTPRKNGIQPSSDVEVDGDSGPLFQIPASVVEPCDYPIKIPCSEVVTPDVQEIQVPDFTVIFDEALND